MKRENRRLFVASRDRRLHGRDCVPFSGVIVMQSRSASVKDEIGARNQNNRVRRVILPRLRLGLEKTRRG